MLVSAMGLAALVSAWVPPMQSPDEDQHLARAYLLAQGQWRLQAQQAGWTAAALDAPCEHASGTPRSGPMPRALIDRFERNGSAFERKWAHRLPVTTPCVEIARPGDVSAFARSFPVAGEACE